jgi:hypothetical protein
MGSALLTGAALGDTRHAPAAHLKYVGNITISQLTLMVGENTLRISFNENWYLIS